MFYIFNEYPKLAKTFDSEISPSKNKIITMSLRIIRLEVRVFFCMIGTAIIFLGMNLIKPVQKVVMVQDG